MWFPRYQAYLRQYQPPTLIVWGPNDGFMPKGAAQAYLRDLPGAELYFMADGGHWLLETHLEEVAPLIGDFLDRNLRPDRGALRSRLGPESHGVRNVSKIGSTP